ncbi:lipoyl protein ligase domain-containing protein [Halomarina oriensis]|uniref:Lipoate--protein ligase family protein n=1 Tax=Halomarina oriensis TaxID=671145 RepID=A0A6B0GJE9_9EURY|nr:lipoate--protein ligase family protein [Halomarina oriensis]MWG34962.1 lipoate--protein ligase family protein [Halomarina oriensis]
MRVVRGRATDAETDRAVTRTLVEDVRDDGEGAVRVWTPHRQVAFGRRDTHADGYEAARAAAEERGFPPLERRVGGRAVAYTGETVAFARVTPVGDMRVGIDERYEAAERDLLAALDGLGVDARPGEPPDSFCPGSHSIQADGKVVGLAQRVQRGVALTAGICVVAERTDVADVLDAVYTALDHPFDPASVGSVASAGGPDDATAVVRSIEDALVGGRERDVERLDG